jgi:hypothetical protein
LQSSRKNSRKRVTVDAIGSVAQPSLARGQSIALKLLQAGETQMQNPYRWNTSNADVPTRPLSPTDQIVLPVDEIGRSQQ